MTIRNLAECFKGAKSENAKYVGVAVQNKQHPGVEIIINPADNFDHKDAYYAKAYNEDLTLKSCPDIQIVGFTFGNSFAEIEADLMA